MKLAEIREEVNKEIKKLVGYRGYVKDLHEKLDEACKLVFRKYRIKLKYDTWAIKNYQGQEIMQLDNFNFQDYKNSVNDRRGILIECEFGLVYNGSEEIEIENLNDWLKNWWLVNRIQYTKNRIENIKNNIQGLEMQAKKLEQQLKEEETELKALT